MTQPNEEQNLRWELEGVQREAGEYQAALSFDDALRTVNEHIANLQTVEQELTRLRTRGFVWWGNLEQELTQAKQLSNAALRSAREESQRASQQLRPRAERLADNAARLLGQKRMTSIANQIDALEGESDNIRTALNAARSRIQEVSRAFNDLAVKVKKGVEGSNWTMDQFDQASFRCRAEENAFCVAAATWEDCSSGAQEGMMYLTDQTFRFERRVAGQQTAMLIEEPLGRLNTSEDSERGWFMKDELLTLTWKSGGRVQGTTTFVFKSADSKTMDEFIERLRTGQLDAWRARTSAVPIAASAAVPVRWPEKCGNCGAGIKAPVRGQTEVECEYCRSRFPVEFERK